MTGSGDQAQCYLDHNATAPLLAEVRDVVIASLDQAGNPSSVHRQGREARSLVEKARRQVAGLVGVDPAQVVFTSGASEAASHVLTPDFRMGRAALRFSRLYVAATEHACVLQGGRFAEGQILQIPVDADGVLDLAALSGALKAHDQASGLPLVAVALANNETGVMQPIEEVAAIVHAHGGVLVVDAVQAAGRLDVTIGSLGADFLLLSAHKIGGPKGVGALVATGQTMMPVPLVSGGGQEKGHRSGTENLSAIAGFGVAAHIAGERRAAFTAHALRLRTLLEQGIRNVAPDAVIAGQAADRLANTTCVVVPGLKAETAQIAFDLEGIAVSAGSACSSGKVGESHVLKAMGLHGSGLRISTGAATTDREIERFLDVFGRLVSRRKEAAPLSAA
jgi:cysteine desulfurase